LNIEDLENSKKRVAVVKVLVTADPSLVVPFMEERICFFDLLKNDKK